MAALPKVGTTTRRWPGCCSSDFLCVACPSTPETRGLIGAEAIAQLPDGAVVTNISRGVIIDDDALIAALRSGKIVGAGLDVFANEPRIASAYRTLPNVFGLPHIGSATMRTRVAMARLLAESMNAVFAGKVVYRITFVLQFSQTSVFQFAYCAFLEK